MILQDTLLRAVALAGAIDPYDESMLQPASIDLRLGSEFRVEAKHRHRFVDLREVPRDLTERVTVGDEGFVLHPDQFALGVTRERITVPENMVGLMVGKSSLARLGLQVESAGFFDPGFTGRGTMEFKNLASVPIVLVPGLPICQFSFQQLVDHAERPYAGRYQGATSVEGSRYGH